MKAVALLLYRLRWHNLHTFDHYALCRLALLASAIFGDRRVANFLEHIVALYQFTKRRVLMIEPMHWCETDKKLRSGRIRIRPACHRDNTALVWMIVKLGLDVVIGSASAVAVLLCRICPKLHDHIAFAGLDYCDFVG